MTSSARNGAASCGGGSLRDSASGTDLLTDGTAAVEPSPVRSTAVGGVAVVCLLFGALLIVGLFHLTMGTSGIGGADLLRGLLSGSEAVGGVPVDDIFTGSRVPRLLAGTAVGVALGMAGAMLQSVTRNPLAAPDTLAVTSGAYLALTLVAGLGLSVPLWASGSVAFGGGMLAALLVFAVAGQAAGGTTTRLILGGSAIAMAMDAVTGVLLIIFKENTTGLYAWGSGSLVQLNADATLQLTPIVVLILGLAFALSRRLDILGAGDDAASSLGVPVRSTRLLTIAAAVLLTSTAVTLAGPIGFVGLGAPVLTRLIGRRIPSLNRHVLMVPASGLIGALLILSADTALRAALTPQGATSIPIGVPTAVLGGALIVILALRLRDSATLRVPPGSRIRIRSVKHCVISCAIIAGLLIAAITISLLAGSLWLRLGDIALWWQEAAPPLVSRALDERSPRVAASVLAGAALGLAGCVVQGTTRNPLAEPGILGITAGAGLGAVVAVTLLDGSRPLLIIMAVAAGLLSFAVISLLTWWRGFLPDRFVLIGIGTGHCLTAATTFLLLRFDPWDTPRLFTWLSGSTYNRTFPDVLPVLITLIVAVPVLLLVHRHLDLLSLDEDTPRVLGIQSSRTRFLVLGIAALLAAVSVVAVGVVAFVGLVAPHMARALLGTQHIRLIPGSVLIGGLLVCVADLLGRTVVAPAQVPAGLMIALIGSPYFVWLLRRTRA